MAAPTGSVAYDKASYAPGEKITATVSYSDPDTKVWAEAFDLTDTQGNVTRASASFSVADPVNSAPANLARTWAKVAGSDTGASVKFTTTA